MVRTSACVGILVVTLMALALPGPQAAIAQADDPWDRIWAAVPSALAATCERLDREDHDVLVPSAASIICMHRPGDGPDDIVDIGFFLFEDRADLMDYWDRKIVGVPRLRDQSVGGASCASNVEAIEPYASGRFACYREQRRARIRWIDEDRLIYGTLDTEFWGLARAAKWWRENIAGPSDSARIDDQIVPSGLESAATVASSDVGSDDVGQMSYEKYVRALEDFQAAASATDDGSSTDGTPSEVAQQGLAQVRQIRPLMEQELRRLTAIAPESCYAVAHDEILSYMTASLDLLTLLESYLTTLAGDGSDDELLDQIEGAGQQLEQAQADLESEYPYAYASGYSSTEGGALGIIDVLSSCGEPEPATNDPFVEAEPVSVMDEPDVPTQPSLPAADGTFDFIGDLAVGPDGDLYVADTYSERIQVVSPAGEFVRSWGEFGSELGQFWYASDLAVSADGLVYVLDANNDRVQEFTSDGRFLDSWGEQGSDLGQFLAAKGIAVDGAGDVYVVDSGNHRIQKFSADGDWLNVWGADAWVNQGYEVTGDAGWVEPIDVAIDPTSGDILTLDSGEGVHRFTSDGHLITRWSVPRWTNASEAESITVGPDGVVLVTIPDDHSIHRFSPVGEHLGALGTPDEGSDLSEFGYEGGQAFEWPRAVAIGADGTGYVADLSRIVTIDRAVLDGSPVRAELPERAFTSTWVGVGPDDNTTRLSAHDVGGARVYLWDVDGDGLEDLLDQTVEYTFDSYGEHEVTLIVIGEDGSEAQRTMRIVVNPAATFAPLLYLHPEEDYWPMSADDYIDNARLLFVHDDGCGPEPVWADVDAADLGSGRYTAQLADADCGPQANTYSSAEHTRPFDDDNAFPDDERGEGFALDLVDESWRSGSSLDRASIYYEYEPGGYLIYWFFYGYNEHVVAGVQAAHEGDWEHIAVRLDDIDQATLFAYYQHACDPVILNRLEQGGGFGVEASFEGETHPVVYSALGSHASYWQPIEQGSIGGIAEALIDRLDAIVGGQDPSACWAQDSAASGTVRWETWNQLADARDPEVAPWYGYGGGWGPPGRGIGIDDGPLGPSPYKLAVAVPGWGPGGSTSDLTCQPDPELMDPQQLRDALPETVLGVELSVNDDTGSSIHPSYAEGLGVRLEEVDFTLTADERVDSGGVRILTAVRVPGACEQRYLDGFGAMVTTLLDPAWEPDWTETMLAGRSVVTTSLPAAYPDDWALYVLVHGDVGMLMVAKSPEQAADFLSGLRLPGDIAGREPPIERRTLGVGGGPVRGTLTLAEPVNEYVFHAVSGDAFALSMRSIDLDSYVQVYSPDGTLLTGNDDMETDGPTTRDSYVEFEVPMNGGYLVRATSFDYHSEDDPGTGDYVIELDSVTLRETPASSTAFGGRYTDVDDRWDTVAWDFRDGGIVHRIFRDGDIIRRTYEVVGNEVRTFGLLGESTGVFQIEGDCITGEAKRLFSNEVLGQQRYCK